MTSHERKILGEANPFRRITTRALLRGTALLCLTTSLTACLAHKPETGSSLPQTTSVLVEPNPDLPTNHHEQDVTYWSEKYSEHPQDKNAAINLSRVLRTLDRNLQSKIIMLQILELYPDDPDVLSEFGKVLIRNGEIREATRIVRHAQNNGAQDWRLLSAYGAALDRSGRYAEARAYYWEALSLAPDHPSILNNLALSYLLDRNPKEAERILRIAAHDPRASQRVHENLALVLNIQRKVKELKTAAQPAPSAKRRTHNPEAAASQIDTWNKLRSLGKSEAPGDRGE